MIPAIPKVGAWFRAANGTVLEVVAWDPEEKSIEVQFFDGTVEEYDFETWTALEPRQTAPPEDWSGSLDLPREDYGVDLDHPAGEDHHNPLDDID